MFDANSFRDSKNIDELIAYIAKVSKKPCIIMEVCGTHTMSIARWAIKDMLPGNIKLISGPGCPVCVTDSKILAQALALAKEPKVIFTCFGDMIRVPAGKQSLMQLQSQGCDIRIVLSPMEALEMAEKNPERQVVFFGVGFETTAPSTAAVVVSAKQKGINNFSVLTAHKTMPAATKLLLKDSPVDAILCPGHVASIVGAAAFAFIPDELAKPAAVAGFEPYDIFLAIAHLVKAHNEAKPNLTNCYPRIVKEEGNITALSLMDKVFEPCAAIWRGLGNIDNSGLAFRAEYAPWDALKKFAVRPEPLADNPACACGQVLRGELMPNECPLFAKVCTPENPAGACMVSSEGSCAAAYRYGRRNA